MAWTSDPHDPYGPQATPPGTTPTPEDQPSSTWVPGGAFTVTTTTTTVTHKAASVGSRIGCSILLLVLLGTGGGIVALVRGISDGTGPFKSLKASSLYASSGSTVVVPGGEPGRSDLVVLVTDNGDGGARKLARVAMGDDGGEETWTSDALPEDLYSAKLAIDGDHLWVGGEDHLLLLSLATGERRWAATLTDDLTAGCRDCFSVAAGTLVVRTSDAYVTAYAPASKEPRWSRRLQPPSGTVVRAGDGVYVVDDPAEPGGPTQIAEVHPATGKVVKSYSPSCPASEVIPYPVEMAGGDPVRPVPGSGDLVSWFGFGYGCVTRFAVATGRVTWATGVGSGNFGDGAVVDGANLVFEASSGPPVRVDLATGTSSLLEEIPDAQSFPRAIRGTTLLGETASTRGSTKGGLAAWDLRTGRRLWSVQLPGSSQPVSNSPYRAADSLSDGDVRTLLVTGGSTVRLVTFAGADRSIRVQSLDPATGELGPARTDTLPDRFGTGGSVSLTVESVTADRLVLGVDSLVAVVDLTTGAAVTWPPRN